MTRGPSWIQGLPEQPFARIPSLMGQDVLLQMTFLTSGGVAAQPTSITYRVDSLTTAAPVVALTSVTPTSSTQTLQLPGAIMQPTNQYGGREDFQVWISAVIPDSNAMSGSITVQQLVIIELVAIAVPPQ
jgi:hypothetical protein